MNAFPMIRTKLSNEHIMAGLFLVLVLYHLPKWYENPAGILRFVLLVIFGMMIDTVAVILRYKRLWCCVSGAVTAAMISLLSVGVPLWGQLLGVAFGLLIGKQLQGGTGKNISNPAMAGMVIILFFFDLPNSLFSSSLLLIPAIVLGLVFLYFRPYAGFAFIIGMLTAMYLNQELTFGNVLSFGVFFWGCLVMTDPVTITDNPVRGSLLGLVSGFIATYFTQSPVVIIAAILFVNILSDEIMDVFSKHGSVLRPRFRIPKVFIYNGEQTEMIDLTDKEIEKGPDAISNIQFSSTDILNRIKIHEVFGMGGAAFPTYRKIKTVYDAQTEEKYLIINAVECDPGLIHDEWLLKNHFTEILQGIELLHTCLSLKETHLAVKDKDQWMESKPLIVDQVQDRYPVGAEKILIHEILGKKLKAGQIPAASGILVLNVQTLYAISQAVLINKPIDTRYLTVADLTHNVAKVVKVKLGMKLQEVMETVYPGTVNIYAGGGIMQAYLAEEDAVIDRSVNFIATGRMPKFKESPQCSKCNLCSRYCPCRLKVRLIADLVDKGRPEVAVKYKVEECLSCGSCSYTCLAGRDLTARVKRAKELSQRRL